MQVQCLLGADSSVVERMKRNRTHDRKHDMKHKTKQAHIKLKHHTHQKCFEAVPKCGLARLLITSSPRPPTPLLCRFRGEGSSAIHPREQRRPRQPKRTPTLAETFLELPATTSTPLPSSSTTLPSSPINLKIHLTLVALLGFLIGLLPHQV